MKTQILDKVVSIFLDIHLWSGRKKLRLEDLKVTSGEIPPEDLASLGSKKICNPENISIFGALKKRAERACETAGIRFLGGYAVPEDKVGELLETLRKIEDEFNSAKAEFVRQYDSSIEEWIEGHPEWETIIRQAVDPVEVPKRQLRFAVQAFKIAGVSEDDDSLKNDGLNKKLGTMGDRLIYEVSKKAEEVWERSFRGKASVSHRVLPSIEALLAKLDSMSFLDGRVGPMVTRVRSVLKGLPSKGVIEDPQGFNALCGVVLQLADPEGIKSLAPKSWTKAAPVVEESEEEVEEVAAPEAVSETPVEKPVVQPEPQPKPEPVATPVEPVPAPAAPVSQPAQAPAASGWF